MDIWPSVISKVLLPTGPQLRTTSPNVEVEPQLQAAPLLAVSCVLAAGRGTVLQPTELEACRQDLAAMEQVVVNDDTLSVLRLVLLFELGVQAGATSGPQGSVDSITAVSGIVESMPPL